jgi:hypothetical protein
MTINVLYVKGKDSLHVLKYKHGEIYAYIERHRIIDDALVNNCVVKIVPFDDHITIWISNN